MKISIKGRSLDKLFGYMIWILKNIKSSIKSLVFVEILMLFSSVSVIVLAILSQKIIDKAGLHVKPVLLISVYLGLMFADIIAKLILSLITLFLNEKIGFGLRTSLYKKVLNKDFSEITKYHTGDLNTRLTSDCNSIAFGVIDIFPNLIVLVLELIITFFTLYSYGGMIAFFFLLFAPFGLVFSFLFGRKLKRYQSKLQKSESRYRGFIQESLSNLMIVKSFNSEEQYEEKLNVLREERFYWVKKKSLFNMLVSNIIEISFGIVYMITFVWCIYNIANNNLTYGEMMLFILLSSRIQSPLMQMASYVPSIAAVFSSAERIIEIEGIRDEEIKIQEELKSGIGIKIDDLHFSYGKRKVLNKLSLNVKPGEFLAVMGASGIGKTTLIRLILGFLRPDDGKVCLYDGINENLIDAGTRKYISYVPQGNTMISGTIRECMQIAKEDVSDTEIFEVLKAADIYEAFLKLPEGLDTLIGEKGSGFSEGQIQRLSIARALLRKSPILILDEATSGLDEKTEIKVLQNLKKLDYDTTCIFITHRKSVLDYCDRSINIG